MAYIRWSGLQEFREELLALPDDVDMEAERIIGGEATYSVVAMRSKYKRRTGNLADHVSAVRKVSRKGEITWEIRSTAKHADIFEFGTQARHTRIGANRGSMPPGRVFWPIYYQRFRVMQFALIEMLKRYGLQVFDAAA